MTRGWPKMKREIKSFAGRLRRDESGAVVILVAIGLVAILGLGALAIDVSRIVYAQRALQATTDLAAQAGATEIYNGAGISATTTVTSYYNAKSGYYEVQRGLNVTSVSATMEAVNGNKPGGCPTTTAQLQYYPACTTSSPNGTSAGGCANSSGCNAILVTQQAKVSLMLGEIFKMGQVTLSASALAVGKGGALPPLNIMIVLDNTASMSNTHEAGASCGGMGGSSGPTKLDCALAGVQTMLAELWPTNDQVGLIVFPPVQTSTAGNNADCSASTQIQIEPYCSIGGACSSSTPASTYQIVSSTNNYRSSNTSTSLTTPNTTSTLINATCQANMSVSQNGVSSTCGTCAGLYAPGGEGTYFAGAINAAQTALVASDDTGICATQTCQNVIIVLSDGGAGNGGTLASLTAQAALVGSSTLSFTNSVPADIIPGTNIADTSCTHSCTTPIPAGTSVLSVNQSTNTVTLSSNITGAGVKSGDTVTFGANNQCWESIKAAQNAAKAGTWVYSIAYGSGVGDSQQTQDTVTNLGDYSSCSDTETPQVNSCYTMYQIASSPAAINDPTKFYSDPMGGSCTSPANPSSTSVPSIFSNIGYNLQYTTLLACGTTSAGGYC
jgi:Flp pilus assembly protein TadG